MVTLQIDAGRAITIRSPNAGTMMAQTVDQHLTNIESTIEVVLGGEITNT